MSADGNTRGTDLASALLDGQISIRVWAHQPQQNTRDVSMLNLALNSASEGGLV
jgi:hypothetical protein